MFESFSDKAIKVIIEAQKQASILNCNYLGTENFLLGLIAEENTVASRILRSKGLELPTIRQQVAKIVVKQNHIEGEIAFTPNGKKLCEISVNKAKQLNHDQITPEHLLLALLSQEHTTATSVLENFGINLLELKKEVEEVLGKKKKRSSQSQKTNRKIPTGLPSPTISSPKNNSRNQEPSWLLLLLTHTSLIIGLFAIEIVSIFTQLTNKTFTVWFLPMLIVGVVIGYQQKISNDDRFKFGKKYFYLVNSCFYLLWFNHKYKFFFHSTNIHGNHIRNTTSL